MNANIWLRVEDKEVWKKAVKIAKLSDSSLSSLVVQFVKDYVKQNQDKFKQLGGER